MQWYEITVILPLRLLESTYNFLSLYVNGIAVEKKEKDFLLRQHDIALICHSERSEESRSKNHKVQIIKRKQMRFCADFLGLQS
jgi:hypothetical protein